MEDVMRNTGICLIATALSLLVLSGCSRESADWKSASTADTSEAYQQFLQQHPSSANAEAARARLKALTEDHDWQAAAATDTREAYEQFVTQHADSKWVQEARIRIENFAQNGSAGATTTTTAAATASQDAAPGSSTSKLASVKVPAKSSAKAPAKATKAAAAHSNFVQLGAFSTKARAQSEWKQLAAKYPSELKALKPDYVAGASKHGTVYRLRVPVSSVAAAKGLCGALKKHSQLCVPVTA
jgi:cell division septation protein DedD